MRPNGVGFKLLPSLGLSIVPAAMVGSFERRGDPWVYDQYRRHYIVWIRDFAPTVREYQIPLLEVTVRPAGGSELLLEPANLSELLPPAATSPRLILFPQTRFSLIEDTVQLLSRT